MTAEGRFVRVAQMTDDDSRGRDIRARREHLGMTVSALAKMAGVDRGKLRRFEAGDDEPSARWVGSVERALDGFEAETGHDQGEGAQAKDHLDPIRLTFHDVYGVGEIIAEAPGDRGDELVAAVVKLLAEIRNGGQ